MESGHDLILDKDTALEIRLDRKYRPKDDFESFRRAELEPASQLSNRFYAEYSKCRQQLYADLVEVNPGFGATILLEKAQKILDRFMFVYFCEDSATGLLPARTVDTLIESAQRSFEDRADKLWRECRVLFRAIDQGMPSRVPPWRW